GACRAIPRPIERPVQRLPVGGPELDQSCPCRLGLPAVRVLEGPQAGLDASIDLPPVGASPLLTDGAQRIAQDGIRAASPQATLEIECDRPVPFAEGVVRLRQVLLDAGT